MKIIKGDILEIKSGIILHQVNCQKVCGGLAGALNRKFPEAFKVYFSDPRFSNERLGTCLVGQQSEGFFVFHLFGQFYPGPNTDLAAVEMSLKDLPKWSDGCEMFAPYQMGCGLGGGNWREYSALLEKFIPQLTIVQKYQ